MRVCVCLCVCVFIPRKRTRANCCCRPRGARAGLAKMSPALRCLFSFYKSHAQFMPHTQHIQHTHTLPVYLCSIVAVAVAVAVSSCYHKIKFAAVRTCASSAGERESRRAGVAGYHLCFLTFKSLFFFGKFQLDLNAATQEFLKAAQLWRMPCNLSAQAVRRKA